MTWFSLVPDQVVESTQQSITTRQLGPTDTLGARVKATCSAGSVTVGWRSERGCSENHVAAVTTLLEKLEWGGKYYGGCTKNGYVFVYVGEV